MLPGTADLRKKYRKFLYARGKAFRPGRGVAWPEELTNHFKWWKGGRDGPESACSLIVPTTKSGTKRKAPATPTKPIGKSSFFLSFLVGPEV